MLYGGHSVDRGREEKCVRSVSGPIPGEGWQGRRSSRRGNLASADGEVCEISPGAVTGPETDFSAVALAETLYRKDRLN